MSSSGGEVEKCLGCQRPADPWESQESQKQARKLRYCHSTANWASSAAGDDDAPQNRLVRFNDGGVTALTYVDLLADSKALTPCNDLEGNLTASKIRTISTRSTA